MLLSQTTEYAMRAVLQAWAIESAPKNLAGTAVGVQFGITTLGASVAPFLFGMIADRFGLYAGFYFLAGVIIFANALVFFMPENEPNAATAQAH